RRVPPARRLARAPAQRAAADRGALSTPWPLLSRRPHHLAHRGRGHAGGARRARRSGRRRRCDDRRCARRIPRRRRVPCRSQRAQRAVARRRRLARRFRSRRAARSRARLAARQSRAAAQVSREGRRRRRGRGGVRRRVLDAAHGRLRTRARTRRAAFFQGGHMSYALRFLGVGPAQAIKIDSSGAVLERNGEPLLLIDCGPETLTRYLDAYGSAPRAVYVTHTHMDHVAGLERLFYRVYFDAALRGNVYLFTHAALVPYLQGRVADYPNVVAEVGANFWDAFRLAPCSRGFWHAGLWFDVFATRHHAPMTSFGLALRDAFAWTGDTR